MDFQNIPLEQLNKIKKVNGWSFLIFIYFLLSFLICLSPTIIYVFSGFDPSFSPDADYSAFWAAGRLTLDGTPLLAYDTDVHLQLQRSVANATLESRPWFNPPIFFFFVAPLAALPYALSLVCWSLVTVGLYLWVAYVIVPSHKAVLLALAFFPVLLAAGSGQTGAFTATLIGGALILLKKKPILAGILIGLLMIKPQLGLLFPFALAAGGYWRAFFAAAVTSFILFLVSILCFGWEAWPAFFESLNLAKSRTMGNELLSRKMQSFFSVAFTAGIREQYVWTIQIMMSTFISVVIIYLWWKPYSYELKAAVFCIGALIVSPYMFLYEYPTLAIAALLLWRAGMTMRFLPMEKLIILWLPLVFFLFIFTLLPVGFIAAILMSGLVFQRAFWEKRQMK